ncbi:branched-chain amino acid transport system permease protein [Nocardia transvalensis]|uniref:Branched-chain amino acid transport system permease protein n=1 Tax=Nocardia transvalensis TaxID=37333 RepID=A0A7W9PH52_9NOCA|nr:ABC transporter permease [Nocardia transvalensis]MBB5915524.1 branched-chain amino acid transport system permease protein [Nocardia transvalensis]
MEQFLAFGIVGLSTAAIYAVIGSGLVLTYTTTGVFNFAHGAAGMISAFVYWQLTIGWGWPVPVAIVAVLLVFAPLFGLLFGKALAPTQGLGDAEKLVMTVALLSGLIVVARWIWDPNKSRSLPRFFADKSSIDLGAVTLTWHQALTMAVAVAVAVALRILLYRTRTGAEMRATVDDRALVGLTGADPRRANRIAWILGIELAAIGGILIAPTVALDAAQLSLLIVSAYTAAIFGRLRNLPMTFAGAVVVGLLESYLTGYLPHNAYLPGLRLAAPALLLFVALLVFPHGRLRGRDRKLKPVPLPTIPGSAAFAVVIVVFGLMLATMLSEPDLITYGAMFAWGVIALSYVPLLGFAGQISLCQLSLAGVGAVAYAHLGPDGQWWALPAAMGIAGVVGAVVAVPALRLSGIYMALATAAFAVILDRWIFTLPSFELLGVRISLFDQGSVSLVGPHLFGLNLDSTAEVTVFAAVCLALAGLAVALLRRSRFGRRLIALRDSEAAYATLGGGLLVARVLVFTLSAAIAGLGGALYGMQLRAVAPDQFNLVAGLPIFLIVTIAGLGVVGAGMFTGLVFAGPLNVIPVLWPGLQSLAQVLPSLGGIAFGGGVLREGAIAPMRKDWFPMLRDRLVAPVLVLVLLALWALRVGDVIDGWMFTGGAVVAAVAALIWHRTRTRPEPGPVEVPVEWWGIKRPWETEDGEVLNRAVATGS